MPTITKDWSSIPQQGGTIGESGVTTILTGSPTSSINGVTFDGNVILDNNGEVIFQSISISEKSSITISTGTYLEVHENQLPSGTINIDGGEINAPNAANTPNAPLNINFGDTTNNTNNVELQAYSLSNITFTNVSPGDNITFINAWGNIKLVDNGAGIIDVIGIDGKTLTSMHTAKKSDGSYYTASDFSASLDGNNSVLVCFLAGSLITTSSNTKAVEDLSVGDEIIAYVDGIATPRRVTWAGQAHCTVRPDLPDDQAGYPVRILKNAIADGVPFKDMLITAEHCLFFDGKFVPARMLVNGRSIFFDRSITSYDYYHIETEEHSVIMADGMLTESYLDTGNRAAFRQTGNIVSLGGSRNLNWNDAAVPLTVSREIVEPLFRRIEARADRAGVTLHTEARPLTNESDLHLMTETGAIIRPARQNNGRVMFMIPSDIRSVRIVSNTSRPCDVIGPFVDDRRNLGVLVGEITLFENNRTHTLTTHLHTPDLSGWNNVEEGTMRWTAGNALIDLGHRAPGSLGLLAIEIKAAGPYLLDDTITEKQVFQA